MILKRNKKQLFFPSFQAFPLIANSSVSKMSVAPPGILGGEPIAPVWFGGREREKTRRVRFLLFS